jgi:prepilin-type N-terminal cleavage/methylation domain-containing protein
MKNPNKNSVKGGFTLIELLVVIAIIAVLAAGSFAGAIALKEKAKRTTAQAAATSLLMAINNFYSDYTYLPDVPASSNTSDPTLLNILAGTESGTEIQNDKKNRYLEIKQAKNGKRDGLVYNSSNQITGLYDPWGQPYYVELDTAYDEVLKFTPSGSPEVTLNGRRAAVYSLGASTVAEAKPNKLVKTW